MEQRVPQKAVVKHHNGNKGEFDKVWRTLRILQADLVQLRSTMDTIERKANRVAVAASRSKPGPEVESRSKLRAGESVRRGI